MVLKHAHIVGGGADVWEWCKNVWYSNSIARKSSSIKFENDVKMYGTQTLPSPDIYPSCLRMM